MLYKITHPSKIVEGEINLTASKSESNRVLLIHSLCAEKFNIANLAMAQDTRILKDALESLPPAGSAGEFHINIGMAGTAMRFLTAYLATRPGTYILTGSERMQKRPLRILVEALQALEADIEYLDQDGFAPIRIRGKMLRGGEIEVDGSVSSQFISALLLIATEMRYGLVIRFKGKVISRPYINMTLKMLEEFRVYGQWHENSISVSKQSYHRKSDPDYFYQVDGDWSAASYYYSMVALSKDATLTISGLNSPSLQGDSIVSDIFTFFGVKTEYTDDGIILRKMKVKDEHFGFDFSDCPDLVQTVAVTAAALGIPCFFNGLNTLKFKETDRILALQAELSKMGVETTETESTLQLQAAEILQMPSPIETYDDHRMAMAFSSLALKFDSVTISDPEVVKKSYPQFWEDIKKLGFKIEIVS